MKSLIIGIARTGKANNNVLNDETRYISMCGNKPEVSFSINCGQDEFIKTISKLRYDDPASSAEAISYFKNLSTEIFADLKYLEIDENDLIPLHIRLVTTPLELAQIPFEFALAQPKAAGKEEVLLLANPLKKITLTREVRQETEASYLWPHMPRILFAWAQPVANMTVPHEEHLNILQNILYPLAKPYKDVAEPKANIEDLLTVIKDASIQAIEKEIKKGIEDKRAYTHIHVLAHGGEKNVYGVTEFRVVLCKEGTNDTLQRIDAYTLANALISGNKMNIPTVVSLSVCDSAHEANTIFPSGSLSYALHNAGIPCVFASQFPLTQTGSVKLIKALFYELINACDPRMALYKTRMALKEDATHDWASLVAYARFPENINEQLQDAQLKMAFALMRTTNTWVDHMFKYKTEIPDAETLFNDLETRIVKSIDQLSQFLTDDKKKSILDTRKLKAEHLGLLGSAYKRKAEFLFKLIEYKPAKKDELIEQCKEALKIAMDFYKCGFDKNADSHWNAMQYLSLKAISTGTLKDEVELWVVIKYMAKRDEQNAVNEVDKIWAWGTLAELFMLKQFIIDNTVTQDELLISESSAEEYLTKIAESENIYNTAKESTARQFERYINWWPVIYPSLIPIITVRAKKIRNILPSLEDLI
jgi:CHAT domain